MLVGEVRWATSGFPVFLKVVGREPVILRAGQRLEIAPGLLRHLPQEITVLGRQLPLAWHHRLAEPVRAGGRRRPQGEERQRQRQSAGTRDDGEGEEPQGGDRARGHLDEEGTHPLPQEPGGPRRLRGRRLPVEEAALRDDEPDERHGDGMHHLPRVKRKEDQRQERLREGGAQILHDAPKVDASRLVRGAPLQEMEQGGDEREGNDREAGNGPGERAPRQEGPRGREVGEERGRHEAAPEVVEDLPLTDEREAVLHETLWRRDQREEPGEDLPVAAHPAVLPPRVREDVGGVIVHHLHVGDESRTRVQPLEEVVRQQRVLGDAPADGRLERVDVVQSLAGKSSFAEQVLVGVRDRRRIGVDAGVPGVHPREERPAGAPQVDAHARLEDAVALRDPAGGRGRRPLC